MYLVLDEQNDGSWLSMAQGETKKEAEELAADLCFGEYIIAKVMGLIEVEERNVVVKPTTVTYTSYSPKKKVKGTE